MTTNANKILPSNSITRRNAKLLLDVSLSADEVAKLFGVTSGRIRQYLTDPAVVETLGAFQMPSGEWRIDKNCALNFKLTRNQKVGARKKPEEKKKGFAERERKKQEKQQAKREFLANAQALLNNR